MRNPARIATLVLALLAAVAGSSSARRTAPDFRVTGTCHVISSGIPNYGRLRVSRADGSELHFAFEILEATEIPEGLVLCAPLAGDPPVVTVEGVFPGAGPVEDPTGFPHELGFVTRIQQVRRR